MNASFYIKEVSWASHESALREIREQVFIVEQAVPLAVEWDAEDSQALHLLAFDKDDRAIACTRILHTGRIGRMGVLKAWRGEGVGLALLNHAILVLKKAHHRQINLSAQTHAIAFYEKAGFKVVSDAYIDVNIWHVDMQLNI